VPVLSKLKVASTSLMIPIIAIIGQLYPRRNAESTPGKPLLGWFAGLSGLFGDPTMPEVSRPEELVDPEEKELR